MNGSSELLKGHTPLLILAVLRDGPRHGYAIAREIEKRSGDHLRFKEGTLYPALHALEREGLILGSWTEGERGARKKVYAVTPAGLAEADDRSRSWRVFAQAVRKVIREEDHESEPSPAPLCPGEPLLDGGAYSRG